MKTRTVVVAAGVLALLSALTISPAFATPPSFGKVSITFPEPPRVDGPWHLKIWAISYEAFERGKLVLRLRLGGAKEAREVVLWTGGRGAKDTISVEYALTVPPPGLYLLSAKLTPFPEDSRRQTWGPMDIIYVAVRPNRVLTSRAGFRNIRYQEIRRELEARGLGDATKEEIRQKAPDLAERIRNLTGSRAVAPVHRGPDSTRKESPPYPVTRPGYHGDSSEAARKGGIPERVLNRRPRHRIDITPPRDTLKPRPDPSQINNEVPARDLSRDSALYMEPWLLERSLRIRRKQDSINSVKGQSEVPDE